MPGVLTSEKDSSGDKGPHEGSCKSAEGLQVASNDAAQEIQNDVEVGLCDGSSETGSSLASKAATASDSNSSAGLNPQPCAHLSTSASHEEAGEDSSTSGVGEPASLAKFDVLRFQNGFLEVVEELRMRRGIDSENEERIEQLVSEKHQLRQKLEEEHVCSASLAREYDQREQDQRRKHEERLKRLQEEKTKHELSSEGWGQELRALKDEIRALHLAKYNLEKKVQEQERKLQLQTVSREGHLSQMAQLEQRCSTAFKQAAEITEHMEMLERNVQGALELNCKLRYDNEHQHCLMESCRTELQACRQQLVEARVRLEGKGVGLVGGAGEAPGPGRTKTTEHDLKMQVELGHQLQSQLAGLREEHQTTLLCLKEAHTLIERHVESSAQLSASEVVLLEEADALRERVSSLEQRLEEEGLRRREAEEKCLRETTEWAEKCSDIERRLKALQTDYSALQESYDKLELAAAASSNLSKQAAETAREAEERLQVQARVREAEEEVQRARERELRREEEWGKKVRRLQQALEQSEALLQEKEQSLEEKAKQLIDLEAKYRNYLQQPTIISLKEIPARDQTSTAMHTESSQPASPSGQPSRKSPQRDRGSPHVASPPKNASPALSPDIISGPQQSGETLLPPSIIEEEGIQTKKHLTPRIYLEKISLPLNPKQEGDYGTLKLKENAEQCQTNNSGENVATDVQNPVSAALSSTKGRGVDVAAEPELQEHYSIKETQTQKQDLPRSPVQVVVHQPKLSPPLFECLPSPSSNGAKPSAATKRSADEITKDLANTESPPKKRKTESSSITDSEMKDASDTSKNTVEADTPIAGPDTDTDRTIKVVSSSDSEKVSGHCSRSQPHSTACALKDSVAKTCTGSQPVPSLIKMPWKLEIPKRRAAAINTVASGSGSEHKEKSCLSTQQQPKPLLPPDQAVTSDLHRKTLSNSSDFTPPLQETNENPLQVSTESQRSSLNGIKISDSKALSTAVTSTEAGPIISTGSKDPAEDSGGVSNPSGSNQAPIVPQLSSDSIEIATLMGDHPTRVETAAGCSLQPAPASTTEGEATSLPLLFSEDEEDEDRAGLLSSQMSRKIDKVQLFLKMDRLRRPKPSRAAK